MADRSEMKMSYTSYGDMADLFRCFYRLDSVI